MKPQEYINLVVGLPYEKGADGPYSFDCWGIVPHSFKEVEGVDIPRATDREACDLNGSSKEDLKRWHKCDQRQADIFCCYKNGLMVHVGRVLDGKALHAAENLTGGKVAVWPWRKLRLVYKKIEFFKYVGE